MGTEVTFGMVFTQMAGLFLVVLLGYWMNRSKKLPEEAEGVLAQITTKLFLPALQISTFAEQCTPDNLRRYSGWIVWGTVFCMLSVLLAVLCARPLAKGKTYVEMVYRYALSFPNSGGFAIPIVLALFGREVFFQYQLFMLPVMVVCYSWGITQLMPKEHQGGWRKRLGNLCNPVFESMILGMLLGLTGISQYLPDLVHTTLDNLGNCYSVVSLLLVGFVIGDYKIKELVGSRIVYLFTAIRLLVIPGLFMAVLKLIEAPQLVIVLTVLVYSCPGGMNVVVYPAAFGKETRPGADMVLVSSILAVLTIPLLCAAAYM